jgi:hypothetical protein
MTQDDTPPNPLERLMAYTEHGPECNHLLSGQCTCGLNDAKVAARKEREELFDELSGWAGVVSFGPPRDEEP